MTPVEPTKTPAEGYHLTEDLVDHAINWSSNGSTLYFLASISHSRCSSRSDPVGIDELDGRLRLRLIGRSDGRKPSMLIPPRGARAGTGRRRVDVPHVVGDVDRE